MLAAFCTLVAQAAPDPAEAFPAWLQQVSLLLRLGGLGLRSAVRTSAPAYWASFADCLHPLQERFLSLP